MFEYFETYSSRLWAISEAKWTRKGLISKRDDIPKWLFNTTVWVNSHWQTLDIFNTTGGDPIILKDRIVDIKERFKIDGLGLHWYF